MRLFFFLLIPSLLFLTGCPDASTPVENNWPPILESWSIAELSTLPEGIQNEINFFDINDGIVFGRGIWFSDDGGRNWTERSPQADIIVDAISFENYQQGIISFHTGDGSNTPFTIFIAQTSDAGQNWNIGQVLDFDVPLSDLYFIDGFDGFAIVEGAPNEFYRSLDGGASWEIVEGIEPKSAAFSERADNQSIQFIDKQIGYVLAANGNNWYKTIDGGESWSSAPIGAFSPRSYQFLSEDSVYFLAERLYLSTDGGTTAELVSQAIFDSFLALPNASIMGMRYKRFDGSNPAQSLNFYTLSYKEVGSSSWLESQEVVNYYFEAYVSTGPTQILGLAIDQQTAERKLYRLQK
ncbi:MAG: hypothetical protein AAFN10_00195 [Bacteroidota bacterium]